MKCKGSSTKAKQTKAQAVAAKTKHNVPKTNPKSVMMIQLLRKKLRWHQHIRSQGTMNQHPPHVHEQLLVGCIMGASSDNRDKGDDECNPAPSTTTKMTRPWH
jgi:hypothetical protein